MNKKSVFRLFKGDQPPATRIFVRGLLVQASIGVHPHEHEETQPKKPKKLPWKPMYN